MGSIRSVRIIYFPKPQEEGLVCRELWYCERLLCCTDNLLLRRALFYRFNYSNAEYIHTFFCYLLRK